MIPLFAARFVLPAGACPRRELTAHNVGTPLSHSDVSGWEILLLDTKVFHTPDVVWKRGLCAPATLGCAPEPAQTENTLVSEIPSIDMC